MMRHNSTKRTSKRGTLCRFKMRRNALVFLRILCCIITINEDNQNFFPLFILFLQQQFGNKKSDSPSFMDN